MYDAESNENCNRVIGDVRIDEISSDTWNRIEEVHGTVLVEGTALTHLDDLHNLKIIGWKGKSCIKPLKTAFLIVPDFSTCCCHY